MNDVAVAAMTQFARMPCPGPPPPLRLNRQWQFRLHVSNLIPHTQLVRQLLILIEKISVTREEVDCCYSSICVPALSFLI